MGRWISKDPVLFGGGANLFAYGGNDPVNSLDPSGLYTEIVFWEPTGWGQSSFGHVSININGTAYSWAPGGMTIQPAAAYTARNNFRWGRGLVLDLSWQEELALESHLSSYSSGYSPLGNNCTDPIESGLAAIGVRDPAMNSLFPTGMARSLGSLAVGQTSYPPSPGNYSPRDFVPPWSAGAIQSFWGMY